MRTLIQANASIWHRLWFWGRQAIAVGVLSMVTWLSLTDSDGMRQHELMHLLVKIHRLTGLQPDKIVHMAMYFCVCGALWIALPGRLWRCPSPVWAFVFATMWGVLMELMQALVTMLGWAQRGFDWQDMLANAVGALLATFLTGCVMILWTWGFCRNRRE